MSKKAVIMNDKQFSFWGDTNTLAKKVYILISGKAGVGKTTSAGILSLQLSDYFQVINVSFAHKIKNIAVKEFGWDQNKDKKGRKLLQDIGMVGRNYNKNIWVENLIYEVENFNFFSDIIIIDDWRFPNELEYIEKKKFQILKVRIEAENREILLGTKEYNNKSETSLPSWYLSDNKFYYDVVIDNRHDMDTLEDSLDLLVKKYFIKGDFKNG